MWSFARVNLGLSSVEFYSLTPRQFGHLCNRARYLVEHQEFLFGQLTSWVASTGFKTPQEPTTARDFMPSMFGQNKQAKPVKRKKRKRSAIATEIRNVMDVFRRGVPNATGTTR